MKKRRPEHLLHQLKRRSHVSQLAEPVGDFLAYDRSMQGGVFVAAGDVTGDLVADITTGPRPAAEAGRRAACRRRPREGREIIYDVPNGINLRPTPYC
jgi:hypothetical protein